MKRFQRASAFLMALVLIASLLPVGVLPAIALDSQQNGIVTPSVGDGKTYLHAVYVSGGVTLGGGHDHTYPLNVALSSTMKLGAAWDVEHLYLTVNSEAPGFTKLQVNGVDVVTKMVTDPGCTEYKISLADAGITSLASGVNKVTVQIGEEAAQTLYLIFENNNYERNKLGLFVADKGLTRSDDQYSASGTTTNTTTTGISGKAELLSGSAQTAMIVELDLDVSDWGSAGSDAYGYNSAHAVNLGGITVQVLDAYCANTQEGLYKEDGVTLVNSKNHITQLFKVGLYKSTSTGKLMLRHYINGTTRKEAEVAAAAEPGVYHIRFEYTYNLAVGETEITNETPVSAKYFVNGKLIATGENVRITLGQDSAGNSINCGTGSNGQFRTRAIAAGMTYTEGNYSISYCDPADLSGLQSVVTVRNQIDAIGTVTAENMEKVAAIRLAYDALTEEHKALVTNLATLEAAEAAVRAIPYIHASFADTGITVDGVMNLTNEPAYRRTIAVGSNKVSAVWDDQGNLYLAATAAITELKLNGKSVTVEADATEVKIPLTSVGVTDMSAKLPISFKVGGTAVNGVLALEDIIFAKAYADESIANGAEFNKVGETTDYWTAILNSYDTANTTQDLYYPNMAGLESSLTAPTVLEMDVTINQLPEMAADPTWSGWAGRTSITGLNIVVMDEDNKINAAFNDTQASAGRTKGAEAMLTGIYQRGGKLYLAYPYNTGATTGAIEVVEIDNYTEGKEYHLRIEYSYTANTGDEEQAWKNTRRDNDYALDSTTDKASDKNNDNNNNVAVKYFVNGKLVSVKEDVKKYREGGWVTSSYNVIQINAVGTASEEGSANITVDDLSATHAQPGIEVVKKIASMDPDSDESIQAARAAFNALTDSDQKALVTNLSALLAAENASKSRIPYLHALAAGGIILDGTLEKDYLTYVPMSSVMQMGAVWDLNYLYLGFTGTDDLGAMTNVTVNGKAATAEKAAGGNEYRIPLAGLGLSVDTVYDLTFTVGGAPWTRKVVLGTNDYATAVLSGTYGAVVDKTLNKRAVRLVSTDGLNGTTVTKYQLASLSTFNYKLEGLPETATIFEFDVKVNQMPDNATFVGSSTSAARTFCRGGLGVTIRDQDPTTVANSTYLCEALFVGLCKVDGDMKLVYWDNDASGFVTADAGDAVNGQYHVRVEYLYPEDVYSNDIAANFFVNGRLVATAESTKQSGGSKSSGAPLGVNIAAYNGAEDTTVDVVVSNVSISHAKGQAYVEKQLDTTEPDQTNIVLQLGADKSQMNFTWFSKDETVGEIKFAKESELVGGQLPANATSVTATRTDSFKAGYVGNKVTITGLEADTTYYYQLINGEDMTELKSFKTGKDGKTFNFAFVGDPQIGRGYGSDDGNNSLILDHLKEDDEHWDRTLNQLITAPQFAGTDFLMSAGDQTNTHLGEYAGHEAQMDAYTNHDVLLGMPTVTVLGNHDADSYAIYDQHFNHPNMLINPETGTYYGATYTSQPEKYLQSADYYFTYNNVLFLVLNTNTYYARVDNSAEHLAFIDRALAETADQDFDWTITLYHQSPYGSSYHQDPDREEAEAYAKMRSVLVPKLYEAGVDMILSGHDHCYTRTYVLKPGTDNGAYNDSYVIQNPEATDAFSNADGILHVTAATSSASQVNADKYNTEAYKVITDTANTRHMTRIEITENTLTLITYNLGTQLSNNITEVDRFVLTSNADATVEAAITAIGDVTLEDEAAIKAARDAYEALSPQLQKRVANLETLTAAEEKLAQLKQEAADKEAFDREKAAAVDALIEALPAVGVLTLDNKDAVAAAREAYTNLTDDQKPYVTKLTVLEAAEAEIVRLQAVAEQIAADKAAAKIVEDQIAALPAVGELTLTDKDTVKAAREAYTNLTDDQKPYVNNLSVLIAAEAEIDRLQEAADKEAFDREKAAAVDALIQALPEADVLTLDDKDAVAAAREAYTNLTDDQKPYVTKLTVLEAAEAKIAQLQAAADKLAQDKAAAKVVDDQITAIGAVTYSKAAAIATVRNAYDALTPDQKDLVENLNTLTAAEAEIAQLQAEVDAVEAAITAIGEVTLSDADAIAQAKTAFEALDSDQQAAVENAAELTAAQAALKALQDAITNVIAQIDAIGTVTLGSKAAIDAAEAAYNALNAEQKALVTNYNKLTDAKEAYEALKEAADQEAIDQAAADAVIAKITAIGTVTLNSKSAIEAAEAAYDALTDAQKDLVTNYATLTAARADYDRLVAEKEAADKAAADAVIAKIAAIGTVTLDSKEAIEDAEAAYAALTADQKALVTNYTTLTEARTAYDAMKAAAEQAANQAAADAAIAKINAIVEVTLESKLAIEAARVAYNALTPEQKAMVSPEILLKLTNAETALKALETPDEPPKTGDAQVIVPVMLLLGLSVAGLAVVLTGKKRFF